MDSKIHDTDKALLDSYEKILCELNELKKKQLDIEKKINRINNKTDNPWIKFKRKVKQISKEQTFGGGAPERRYMSIG